MPDANNRQSSAPEGNPVVPAPTPVKPAILAALAAMFEPNDVIELRSFARGKKRTDAGYFDGAHRDALADAAMRLNSQGAAIYVTLNRIDPQLLARYCNRVESWAADTATDANVIRRRWLLIDLDPVRPKNTAATDSQLASAKERAQDCYRMLKAEGWPEPLAGESGNGWHLLYPLDLPNDADSTALVKGALAGLAARFDDAAVKVDQAVFNAARITKLYGTVATKGDHTVKAPWRFSRLVSTPVRGIVTTVDQLRALLPVAAVGPAYSTSAPARVGALNLPDFLNRLGIDREQDRHEGRERYRLAHCPFNDAHGKGEAAIFRSDDGMLGFKCQHDSCAGKGWQDVRALVDGPRDVRTVPLAAGGHGPEPWRWGAPQSLSAKIEREPYPVDALPHVIRATVEEVVGFVKAPLPLVATSALAALSLAAQAQADVKRAEKLQGPSGLYLLAIADSGERKTTCDGFFTAAIREYEQQQAEAAKPVLKKFSAEEAAWAAERDGILMSIKQAGKTGKSVEKLRHDLAELEHAKPEPPRVPRLIYGDATPEALTFSLAKRWPSGGVISSEAGAILGAHGMGKESIMRNLAILNELWDGRPQTFDRRTSESYTVRGARLTVALQIQEPTLREFFGRAGALARGTGFLARFLIAWPESTQGQRPFTESPTNWPALAAFHRRIEAVLAMPVAMDDDGALAPVALPLAPDAKVAWIAFHDGIESELSGDGELHDVRDVASKAADNAARLAALFHAFEGGGRAISVNAFASAARIVAWHLNESRRFFGELALPAELVNAARLDAWLIDYCRRERMSMVPTKTVLQRGPALLRDKAALEAAVRELEDLGRGRLVQDGRRKLIEVNSALLPGGCE